MLYSVFSVLTAICYLFAAALGARFFIHMFQLNSYKPKVQLKWVKKNSRAYLGCHLALFLAGVLCFVFIKTEAGFAVTSGCFCAAFLVSGLTKLPKRSYKTPLKYTKRVIRLIVTLLVILILPFLVPVIFGAELSVLAIAVCSLWLFLLPLLILFANMLNRPLELSINKMYIRDAKRILKSCPSLIVIGITGSFGKTSVKYFLDTLLSVRYNVLKTPGNFNTPLGVVKTIRGELRAIHDIFLCEMGAKNVGDIREICDIVHPKHGIITSVGPMHLESFKTIDNVRNTKFELADSLPDDGLLFLNMDDENIQAANHPHRHIAYGIDNHSGYYVTDLRISERGSEFTLHSPDGKSCEYKTALIGRHNVVNICGAIAVSHSLGISLEELRPAVRRLESVPHRLQLINRGDYSVIDDAYNSNPSGTKAALEALSMTTGMKILVTPGMIELGEMEYELNRQFGVDAAEVCDFVALVGEKQTKPIYDGLAGAGFPEDKIYVAQSLQDAMHKVYSLTSDGRRKIILLENDLPDNY